MLLNLHPDQYGHLYRPQCRKWHHNDSRGASAHAGSTQWKNLLPIGCQWLQLHCWLHPPQIRCALNSYSDHLTMHHCLFIQSYQSLFFLTGRVACTAVCTSWSRSSTANVTSMLCFIPITVRKCSFLQPGIVSHCKPADAEIIVTLNQWLSSHENSCNSNPKFPVSLKYFYK